MRVTFVAGTGDVAETMSIVGESFRVGYTSLAEDTNANGQLDDGEDLNDNGLLDDEVRIDQTLWRTGNRDLTGGQFTWVRSDRVLETSLPDDFLYVERQEDGRAIGRLEAVAIEGRLYEGFDNAYAALTDVLPKVQGIGERIFDIKNDLGGIAEQRDEVRMRLEAAEQLEDARAVTRAEAELERLSAQQDELQAERRDLEGQMADYRIFLASEQGPMISITRTSKTANVSAATVLDRDDAERVASVRLLDFTESNSRPATIDDAPLRLESTRRWVEEPGATVITPKDGSRPKVQFVDADGNAIGEPYTLPPMAVVLVADGAAVERGTRVAIEPLPMTMGQVVRAFVPNRLSLGDKFGVYFSRWWEFLSAEPRDSNTEGGVFPQIVGTVLLTFIMIVFVVPVGVVAAIYLREYAKQGALVSFVRICVNNLAGVPSIVYGVFGLGFFCYGLGGWMDAGAAGAGVDPLPVDTWLLWIAVAIIFAAIAIAVTSLANRSDKGAASQETLLPKAFRFAAGLAWAVSVVVVFYFIFASVPKEIFGGFYPETLTSGSSEWKGQALIWASLTLALLTLPVVIVSTEEALAAVPRSMREGSYACGASKWQTIRTIVLPRALPGIMTGAILAIARGAGEVAPIMLVGALKTVRELPLNGDAPFIHLDQAFMHLGFHIFDLGFHSPDAEASRSSVYTTTLLLILIVLLLNLAAIWLRSRLRRAFAGGAF
ncbi:MAG: ABC transporter permease subunit [Planctomycetota bacterium]